MNPHGIVGFTVNPFELALWNAANERARREYEAHPIAACATPDCPNLAVSERCRDCLTDLIAARARMQDRRRS